MPFLFEHNLGHFEWGRRERGNGHQETSLRRESVQILEINVLTLQSYLCKKSVTIKPQMPQLEEMSNRKDYHICLLVVTLI